MVPEACGNSFATRIEGSAEPAGIGVAFARMPRALCRRFAGWPAIVGVAALLVAGCGERSPPTRTACEASRAPASDRPKDLNPAVAKRLQDTLDRVRREQKIPGAAAAVVIGDCLWVGASGLADVRSGHRPPHRARESSPASRQTTAARRGQQPTMSPRRSAGRSCADSNRAPAIRETRAAGHPNHRYRSPETWERRR